MNSSHFQPYSLFYPPFLLEPSHQGLLPFYLFMCASLSITKVSCPSITGRIFDGAWATYKWPYHWKNGTLSLTTGNCQYFHRENWDLMAPSPTHDEILCRLCTDHHTSSGFMGVMALSCPGDISWMRNSWSPCNDNFDILVSFENTEIL